MLQYLTSYFESENFPQIFGNIYPQIFSQEIRIINGLQREKTCIQGFANNKGADQPALPCSLISALLFAYWKVV